MLESGYKNIGGHGPFVIVFTFETLKIFLKNKGSLPQRTTVELKAQIFLLVTSAELLPGDSFILGSTEIADSCQLH